MTVGIALGPFFSLAVGWVGSGHTKWTHGQLWADCSTLPAPAFYAKLCCAKLR